MRLQSAPDSHHLDRLPRATGGITRLAYARAETAGVKLEPILKAAALTRNQIEDPHASIKVRDQIKFLNLVASALDDDLLGFHLAQNYDLRDIGLLYYVFASSEVLSDALHRVARYSSIVNEGVSQKCIDNGAVGMLFGYVGVSRHLDRHQIEFWITSLVRTCRQLTGHRLLPCRLQLIHRRDRKAELSDFFGDVEYGAAVDEITFPRGIGNAPIVDADPYLNKLLISYCEEAAARSVRIRGSFQSNVENVIVPLLPHGKAQAGEIARRLGISQRTFARRLSAEGLTFSELLENLRSDLAGRYLADGDLAISQIAWLLGYREVGSFSHAFRRWTGKTPREMTQSGLGKS
jgi:AraC-like DNA-binding protein